MERIELNSIWKDEELVSKKPHQKYVRSCGTILPGVTTILGEANKPALMEWAYKLAIQGIDYKKVRDQAADVGTASHFICECYIKQRNPVFKDLDNEIVSKATRSFKKFQEFWDTSGFKTIEVESQLVSETQWFGGTIDYVVENREGNLLLMDLKTSKGIYESYVAQVAAYSKLWNENRERKISAWSIFRIGKEDPEDQEYKELFYPMILAGASRFNGLHAAYQARKEIEALMKIK